jgi:glycine/D-amino acid oxidase-like deaminating enzyme
MTAEIVICGAGIAGVAAAWALAERGVRDILLVDERPPLSLTSDKSSECYRTFWPGPGDAMVRLMSRSVDLLEGLADASGNAFGMNRRGYLYVTEEAARVPLLRAAAEEACGLGDEPLRIHHGITAGYTPASPHGYTGQPDGADLLLGTELVLHHFPFLSERAVAALHVRRAGWLSAQQLGAHLLEQARAAGVQLVSARIEAAELSNRCVQALRLSDRPERVVVGGCVNAAGPMLREVGRMLGEELPVFSERHLKLAFEDRFGAVPRDAPMVIRFDPLTLAWDDEERALLAESPETRRLLEELPAGAHLRPEGAGASQWVLALWAYHAAPTSEAFPLLEDEQFPEVALRGAASLVPALRPYLARPPRPVVDGGYYTKTRENRPLIGPMATSNAYVLGALSGYGIMAACGAAELLAAHILAEQLPDYAPAFHPARYQNQGYRRLLESWGDTGQL